MPTVTGPIAVTMRPAGDADLPFLREVYASTRAAELAVLAWSEDEKQAFVDMQFRAQMMDYQRNHPAARYFVLMADDRSIGRLFLADLPGELRILDIAILPAYANHGIGTAVLQDVLFQAGERGVMVSLYVERWNPARRAYVRLGFEVVGDNGADVYLRMEARPRRP